MEPINEWEVSVLGMAMGMEVRASPETIVRWGVYAKEQDCSIHISDATDECNANHLKFMVDNFEGDEIKFTCVTYKPESTILEESQQLAYAVALANKGVTVTISERPEVMKELKKLYGGLFNYAV